VNAFGLAATRRMVEKLCGTARVSLRKTAQDAPLITDGGHLILDAHLGRIENPEALSAALHRIPGVVEHGLFIGLCSRAFLASPDGVAVLGRTA
jgi:ribose 5-phosphate isomerase A